MDLYVTVGDAVEFRKTVSEADVYLFAGVTGDFAPHHVDEEFMRHTSFGKRIAHGALIIGFMSACSTKIVEMSRARGASSVPVSLGYDRIRFLEPVYLGDTVCCAYRISSVDQERLRAVANIEVKNQRNQLVAVATHLLKWIE